MPRQKRPVGKRDDARGQNRREDDVAHASVILKRVPECKTDERRGGDRDEREGFHELLTLEVHHVLFLSLSLSSSLSSSLSLSLPLSSSLSKCRKRKRKKTLPIKKVHLFRVYVFLGFRHRRGFFAFEFALSHSSKLALFAFSTKKERKKERKSPPRRALCPPRKEEGALRVVEEKERKEKKRKEKGFDDAAHLGLDKIVVVIVVDSLHQFEEEEEEEKERDKRRVRCQLHDHDSRNESSETRRDESRVREKATRIMWGERGVASGVDSRGRDRPRKERCIRATEAAEKEGILR